MQDKIESPISVSANSKVAEVSEPSFDSAKIEAIRAAYANSAARNHALLDEVVFILTERIAAAGVKIHSIERRVKELPSVIKKCQQKGTTNIEDLVDVVGTRVVSLFRSDLAQIGKIVAENFDVIHTDDKVAKDPGSLGYMSIHYICKMPSRYKGPRYDNTAGVQFEIQVRTLCMHAWAAVSHYLDYKGDWDVPVDLKRSLSALSGLFYVADTEFEQFYAARIESKRGAERLASSSEPTEVNLDTVTAFLQRKFPERHQTHDDAYSSFVRELKRAGFDSLVDVERDIDRGYEAFLMYEKENPPAHAPQFADVGAARLSLGLASGKFYTQLRKSRKGSDDGRFLKFRDHVK